MFQEHSETKAAAAPALGFKHIFKNHKRSLLVCVGLVLVTNVTYYMLLTYLPSYFSHNLGYSADHGVLIIIAVMIGMLFVQPIIGALSDRYGRRPFFFIGSLALVVLPLPAFWLLATNVPVMVFLGLLGLALSLNMLIGVMAATLPALFPTAIRYTGLAIAFNVSVVIAGLTPTITSALVEMTHNLYVPAYYLIVFGFLGLVATVAMPETANKPLRGSAPMASNKAEARELLEEHHDRIEERIEDIDQQIAALQTRRQKLANQHPQIN